MLSAECRIAVRFASALLAGWDIPVARNEICIGKQKAADVGHFGRDEAAATIQFFAEMAVPREIFSKTGVVR